MSAFEEAKGKLKQAAGDVTDNEDLRREGKAQEHKSEAEDKAAAARAEARTAETEAAGHELDEEAAQQSK
jgi:uncharacterized protein YjbJ (UPF0337 family)